MLYTERQSTDGNMQSAQELVGIDPRKIKAVLSHDKQRAHDNTPITAFQKDGGGWISQSQVAGLITKNSQFYVGEDETGQRHVFGIVPNREDFNKLPVGVISTINHTNKLNYLKAVREAEKKGDITTMDARQMAASLVENRSSNISSGFGIDPVDAILEVSMQKPVYNTKDTYSGSNTDLIEGDDSHRQAMKGVAFLTTPMAVAGVAGLSGKGRRVVSGLFLGTTLGQIALTGCTPIPVTSTEIAPQNGQSALPSSTPELEGQKIVSHRVIDSDETISRYPDHFDFFKKEETFNKVFNDKENVKYGALSIEVTYQNDETANYVFFTAESEKEQKGVTVMVFNSDIPGNVTFSTIEKVTGPDGIIRFGIAYNEKGQKLQNPFILFSTEMTQEELNKLSQTELNQLVLTFVPTNTTLPIDQILKGQKVSLRPNIDESTPTPSPTPEPSPTPTPESREYEPPAVEGYITFTENITGHEFKVREDADPKAIYEDIIVTHLGSATSKSAGMEENRKIYEEIIIDHPEWNGIGNSAPYEERLAFMQEFLKRSGGLMIVQNHKFEKMQADFNKPVVFEVVEVDEFPKGTIGLLHGATTNNGTGAGGIMLVNDGNLTYRISLTSGAIERTQTDTKYLYKSWKWTIGEVLSDIFRKTISETAYKDRDSELHRYKLYVNSSLPKDSNYFAYMTWSFIE